MTRQLNVTLHGRLVATITNAPGDTNVVALDRDFATDPDAPVLSFNAFRDPVTRAYRTTFRPTQTVVHPYFANLLPEGLLREYLARQAHVKPIRDFPLLRLLGGDLPGALIMRDADADFESSLDLDRDREDDRTEFVKSDPKVFRFSLAGVQLKFSAGGDPKRGLTIPVGGQGGSWIVKLPDQRFSGVPENEFSMMTFAKAVGIDVPEIGLVAAREIAGLPSDVEFSGKAYYIQRFDRTPVGERIHMEDFAQANALYPAEKYERFNFDQLLSQVADLMGCEVAMNVLQRIVFNIGIGNGDMHAKNWSVLYFDDRTPTLAPAYDYLSTIKYIPADDLGMKLAKTKQFADIDLDRITRLASRARLSAKTAERVALDMVERMRDVWRDIKEALPIDEDHKVLITKHMDTVPLFRGTAPAPTRKAGVGRRIDWPY